MQNTVYIKEKISNIFYPDASGWADKTVEAYTSLKWLLASEGIEALYHTIRRFFIAKNEAFYYKNVIIRKVKLNHYKHDKTQNQRSP